MPSDDAGRYADGVGLPLIKGGGEPWVFDNGDPVRTASAVQVERWCQVCKQWRAMPIGSDECPICAIYARKRAEYESRNGPIAPVDHTLSSACRLWQQADAEISATCACPKNEEDHRSAVRVRYLELWEGR